MRPPIVAALLFLAPTLGACGTAHIVRADPHGGEVVLEGGYMESVADARLLMSEHCGGRFTILSRQGPAVVLGRGEKRARFECVAPARERGDAYGQELARGPAREPAVARR